MRTMRFAAVLAGFLAPVVATETSFAHALLTRAEPPVGGTVQASPTVVVITFSSSVEPDFSTIVVQDANGVRVDRNDTHLAAGDDTRLAVDVRALPAGSYTVTWHATSTDTHKTQGKFSFTVER